MGLVGLIVLVAVAGLALWLVNMLPIPDPFGRIINVLVTVVVVLFVIIWLLRFAGVA